MLLKMMQKLYSPIFAQPLGLRAKSVFMVGV
jgi:hypothetical protein